MKVRERQVMGLQVHQGSQGLAEGLGEMLCGPVGMRGVEIGGCLLWPEAVAGLGKRDTEGIWKGTWGLKMGWHLSWEAHLSTSGF